MGTALHMSSAYHPQTDGQTERPQYNTISSSLWLQPTAIGLFSHQQSANAAVEDYLQKRQDMGILLKSTLEEAQHRIKQHDNKRRTDREFQVGDWVYLRLQPYRQTSVQLRRSLKLSAKFFGPYQVTAKIGKVAYKLNLPVTSRIHPVFHVSQLKPKLGEGLLPQTTLPSMDSNGCLKVTPFQILSTRTVKKNQQLVDQVLVHWNHSAAADATREDKALIKQQFPKLILEDKNQIE
ncbi:uncharacterized protein LOC113359843 [Papaver somniferum]|uniref:uncharacterized protein LOC113359843 n=1 Tax=Papaver somniferum TaxID=3469 RepID=UPI000E6F6549|nr:uncharacterized protein LOC113359843 [Papaver somniferum]